MSKSFKRLERVLRLEQKQGYQNKAVVGGIRQFATYWVEQARQETVDELDEALVEQTAEVLTRYAKLPGREARATALDNLLEKLAARQERVGNSRPAQHKSQPSPAAQAPPKPAQAAAAATAAPATPPPSPVKQPVEPDPAGLAQSVTMIYGVGPALAKKLAVLGATTINELLHVFPRRYDDYTLLKPINRLQYGEQVTVIGTVWETRSRRLRGNQTLVQSIVTDGSGRIHVTWFNQPWLANKLHAGMKIVIRGKVDQYLGRPVFNSPEWEPLSEKLLRTGRIVPVYPLTEGLKSIKMRKLMHATVDKWADRTSDPLPDTVRQRRRLLTYPQALRQIHFPDSHESLHAARRRLAFDELLLLQLGMLGQRREWQAFPGHPLPADSPLLQSFLNSLPFTLTGAQQRVVQEIAADMSRPVPMNRLLQGDVGAGKTVVAAAAMALAVAAGMQAALMAPTEILAEQHFQGLSKLLEPLGVSLRLLTGSVPAGEKQQIYQELSDGTAQIVIGTHALIQEGVQFRKLALAVIDEQHRFGVDQRQALRDKGLPPGGNAHAGNGAAGNGAAGNGAGTSPHLLVMSATPIPRTLALSLYGDLDLSIIDELPPGREEIKTRWIMPSERERAYSFVRGQVEQGRQAFIICPLVEESDKIAEKAAVEEHARLQAQVFPDLKLGLLHGRMSGSEKEAVMRRFYAGEDHILVSTSVIEVGVDVPNSTVMLIEGANRFGLAQLHQFRGRVGRGENQSYCLLVAESTSRDAEERLEALEQTNDGFLLAEKDLELRGPGEFFGRRQSGLPELRLASLLDVNLLEEARAEAEKLFAADPLLENEEHAALQERVAQFWESAGDMS